jgi:hypothetical protein
MTCSNEEILQRDTEVCKPGTKKHTLLIPCCTMQNSAKPIHEVGNQKNEMTLRGHNNWMRDFRGAVGLLLLMGTGYSVCFVKTNKVGHL